MHFPHQLLLALAFILLRPAMLVAAEEDDRDTMWIDPATGSRVHLLRLSDTDTLVIPRRNVIKPVFESLGINFGVWGWDHFVTDRGWADINGHTISTNLKHNFVLDTDSYSGNQFSHPYHGSMFYNAARYHGNGYFVSALYPLVGSMTWEYFCETNLPAYNDFFSTGIGGTAIGETLFRTSDITFDNSKTGLNRVLREIAGTALNPARGLHRLLSGEMWRVSPSRGKRVDPEPFSLDVGVGNRHIHELRHRERSRDVAYVDFTLNYGDHFREHTKPAPFDYFRLRLLMNLASRVPTFGDVDIRGRILGKQWIQDVTDATKPEGWAFDLGLYQNFRYIDNYGDKKEQRAGDYPLVCEAASFGVGGYARNVGRRFSFSNDFSFNGIGFGCVGTDYSLKRRYNFASGFSLRNDLRFSLNRRFCIGEDFYFARLYVPKGNSDPTYVGLYNWGDRGHSNVFLVRNYLNVNIGHNLKLNAEHLLHVRRSTYYDHPDIHAKSYELKLGLIYSI